MNALITTNTEYNVVTVLTQPRQVTLTKIPAFQCHYSFSILVNRDIVD